MEGKIMPLPLFLLIGAGVAGAVGLGSGIHGAVQMKDANDTMKSAQNRHNENIKKFGVIWRLTDKFAKNSSLYYLNLAEKMLKK